MTTRCCGCSVGGHLAYLEPDVVAFQVGGRFHVVEIKSFAVIDGQADEESVAAAAMQAAVYVLALQDLLTAEDLPAVRGVRQRHPGHPGELLPQRHRHHARRAQAGQHPAPPAGPDDPHRHAARRAAARRHLRPDARARRHPRPARAPSWPPRWRQSRPDTSHAACAPASWRASAATKPAPPTPWTCWARPCARTSAAWTPSIPRSRSPAGSREPSADQADITRALRHARTLRDELAGGAA